MTKRAEELAEFPPKVWVFFNSENNMRVCHCTKIKNWIPPWTSKANQGWGYISVKEHQAILSAAEKDALNSEDREMFLAEHDENVRLHSEVEALKAENEKFRKALENIYEIRPFDLVTAIQCWNVAGEALAQGKEE